MVGILGLLHITDGTRTTYLNTNGRGVGFNVIDWTPLATPRKGGGIWQGSPFADGSQLVSSQFDNAGESWELAAGGGTQDDVIHQTQNLRRLIEDAVSYWVQAWQDNPVWLVASGDRETNTRYAIIKSGEMPQDDNPHDSPFSVAGDRIAMADLVLNLIRGHWQSTPPGTGECLPIAGYDPFPHDISQVDCDVSTAETAVPLIPLDDTTSPTSAGFGFENLMVGIEHANMVEEQQYEFGFRARVVDVPNGAITQICSAHISLVGTGEFYFPGPSATMQIRIDAQDDSFPANFTEPPADFPARPRTAANVVWVLPANITAGTVYTSPDISAVIQEIIDRVDWQSGGNIVIFIEYDNGIPGGLDTTQDKLFAAFENPTYAPPQLSITWADTSAAPVAGQNVPTCSDQVYVANKHNRANLTHAFRYNGAVYSGNLLNAAEPLPYNLLPAGAGVNSAFYFGVAVGATTPGPFSSLVLDIQQGLTGLPNLLLEYWNGGWVTVPGYVEDTSALASTGVGSWHWDQPSDWAATVVNAVNALWMRIRVSAGAGVLAPVQQHRLPYTITWGNIEIQEEDIRGDISALAHIKARMASSKSAPGASALSSDKILLGVRGTDRGLSFQAYLNLGNAQNPGGVLVNTIPAVAAFNADMTSPSGVNITWTPSAVPVSDELFGYITLGASIVGQYYGRFRMFIRGRQTGGVTGDIGVYAALGPEFNALPPGTSQISRTVWTPYVSTSPFLLDMGEVVIPSTDLLLASDPYTYYIALYGNNIGAGPPTLSLYDVILLPIDEWACESVYQQDPTAVRVFSNERYHSIDSISYPKAPIRTMIRTYNVGSPQISMTEPVTIPPAILSANRKQRIWFIAERTFTLSTLRYCEPEVVHEVRIDHAARYLSMRGAR